MSSYIKCGICQHTQSLRWSAAWAMKVDSEHMHDHYKHRHNETVLDHIVKGDPAVAYSNYPVYKAIPLEVAPKVFDGDKEFKWSDLLEFANQYS